MSYTSETIVPNKTIDITNFDYHKEKNQTGFITMYPAGATIPDHWLLCNGQSVSTTLYPDLYALIGNKFGGSGTNFNLPNLNNSIMVGTNNASNIGVESGTSNVTLTISHFPSHNHSVTSSTNSVRPTYSASYNTDRGTNGNLRTDLDQVYLRGWGGTRSSDYLNTANIPNRGNCSLSISSNNHHHSAPAGTLNANGSSSNTYNIMPSSVKLYFIIKAS
jgi:microcystin-dependent protein